ncbi:peptidase C39 [Mitsuokella sp. AF21-1AC]|uniref:peptidase C39 n=1 Tax=Mitsuokella sp. AF21-1AC TaxID=2292235 RepID=UPI000E4C7B8E|nr:peptidase C39 [Mitsuokella sp. AF21-1AC]RGS74771.1 peptidase C39 [Mitsuokella sp. AF21-1AC]
MKSPLRYQFSEYDCGPTTMLNAVSYLFEREEIPPEIIRNVMLYSLDCYSNKGEPGRAGTSRMAMMFLSNWLDGFGRATNLPLSSQYLSGKAVYIGQESLVNDALHRGGAVVVRLFYEVEHYALLTGVQADGIRMFDPWYVPEESREFDGTGIRLTLAAPKSYNRIVPFSCFNRESNEPYALGPVDDREAVLLFNKRTEKTAQDTIEYFI